MLLSSIAYCISNTDGQSVSNLEKIHAEEKFGSPTYSKVCKGLHLTGVLHTFIKCSRLGQQFGWPDCYSDITQILLDFFRYSILTWIHLTHLLWQRYSRQSYLCDDSQWMLVISFYHLCLQVNGSNAVRLLPGYI